MVNSKTASLPVLLFILLRALLLLALPFDGLRGYGDHLHFFNLAALPGLPYFNYWAEFPPFFPFLSELLYSLSGGVEHVYTYLLIFLLALADLGSLILFLRLSARIPSQDGQTPALLYAALLGGLAYTWWYFDSLAVFFMLLSLELAFSRRSGAWSGLALGLGILTKLFPALLLPALWKALPRRRALTITAVALTLTVLVYGSLWWASPNFTAASLRSQSAKGSWETVWALIDGNLITGNFGPELERLDPATALLPRGSPPLINPWLRLLLFGALGGWLFLRARLNDPRRALLFGGLTWAIFLLWSPGWSVQWVLYLIPLILLTLPQRTALLLTAALVFTNLLEWPVLLSRGLFSALPFTILLRTLLLGLLALVWWQTGASQAALSPPSPAPESPS